MFIKNLLKGILLSTAFVVSANATKISPRYPLITEIHGRVWLTNGKSNERVLLKTKAVLMERALLETEDGAQITVALDAQRQFTVLEGSTILLPTISWEGGEAPVIVLKRGNMRWQQLSEEKPSYNVDIRSELFEFQAPKGDFIFTMEPEKAYAGVKVLSGNLDFSALNGEESASVHAGQQVGFQGVIEGKEIAFDVLLKGKKIPKGRLTPVAEISKKDLAEFSGEKQKQEKAKEARKAQEKKNAAEAKKVGAICQAPAGKFNQCTWICQNNPKSEKKSCLVSNPNVTCVRRRCNANGEWAEESIIDVQKSGIQCKAQPIVAPCDY